MHRTFVESFTCIVLATNRHCGTISIVVLESVQTFALEKKNRYSKVEREKVQNRGERQSFVIFLSYIVRVCQEFTAGCNVIRKTGRMSLELRFRL